VTIGPELGIALMMNNYLHDVATALLAGSGAAMWIMTRAWDRTGTPAAAGLLAALHRGMTRLAGLSLAWIVVGGVPRVYFYESFEWANAAGRGQVAALAVKHVLMFTLVGGGGYLWLRLRRKIRAMSPETSASAPAAAR
jgi:hypothetical protein